MTKMDNLTNILCLKFVRLDRLTPLTCLSVIKFYFLAVLAKLFTHIALGYPFYSHSRKVRIYLADIH